VQRRLFQMSLVAMMVKTQLVNWQLICNTIDPQVVYEFQIKKENNKFLFILSFLFVGSMGCWRARTIVGELSGNSNQCKCTENEKKLEIVSISLF
jgi:hypothetical protein